MARCTGCPWKVRKWMFLDLVCKKNQERQVCDVETRSSVSDTLQLSTVSIQISSKYSDLGQ